MSDKVKLSKDGSSIDFVQSENLPTSLKKFRQSPEIEGFYRFIYENDLQKEAFEILEKIIIDRKAKKSAEKALAKGKDSKETKDPKQVKGKAESAVKTKVADLKRDGAQKTDKKILAASPKSLMKTPAKSPTKPVVKAAAYAKAKASKSAKK